MSLPGLTDWCSEGEARTPSRFKRLGSRVAVPRVTRAGRFSSGHLLVQRQLGGGGADPLDRGHADQLAVHGHAWLGSGLGLGCRVRARRPNWSTPLGGYLDWQGACTLLDVLGQVGARDLAEDVAGGPHLLLDHRARRAEDLLQLRLQRLRSRQGGDGRGDGFGLVRLHLRQDVGRRHLAQALADDEVLRVRWLDADHLAFVADALDCLAEQHHHCHGGGEASEDEGGEAEDGEGEGGGVRAVGAHAAT
eukprot:scaffold89085_cov63-Phaeocystis_antarctica.AAC.2